MRRPLEDVFPVEPVTRPKSPIVTGAILSANAVSIYFVSSFLGFHYAAMCEARDDCHEIKFIDTIPGPEVLLFFIFLVAFANVSVSYLVLLFVDSAEVRRLLRTALHVAVWASSPLLPQVVWYAVGIVFSIAGQSL